MYIKHFDCYTTMPIASVNFAEAAWADFLI